MQVKYQLEFSNCQPTVQPYRIVIVHMLFVSGGFFFLQLKKEPVKTNKIFFWGFKSRTSRSLFSRVHAYIFSYTVTKKPLYYFMNKKSKEYTEMIEFSIDCRYFGFCNIQEIVYCLM